jgi:hypothetical protein
VTPLLGFGGAMLAGALLLALLGGHEVELALQGGAGAASVLLGLSRARPGAPPSATARVARSGATVLVALGVASMAFGAEVGQWLILIGAGLVAVGVGGLVAERRRA